MCLDNQIAIITGAGQGLGQAIAEEMARQHAHVVVAELNDQTGQQTVQRICDQGGSAESYVADVTSEESIDSLVDQVIKDHHKIDILVNNAGLGQSVVPVIDLPLDEFQRVLQVNLTGTFLCSKKIGRQMALQESGKVVNLSSLNGVSPAALVAAYNVAKAGVISLSQTMALELAPYGVRVNAVAPGPVYTEFNEKVMAQRADILNIDQEEMIERVRTAVPLGRWGKPEDIANTVVFLCSDRASWITGQVFPVTGGLSGVSAAPPKQPIREK